MLRWRPRRLEQMIWVEPAWELDSGEAAARVVVQTALGVVSLPDCAPDRSQLRGISPLSTLWSPGRTGPLYLRSVLGVWEKDLGQWVAVTSLVAHVQLSDAELAHDILHRVHGLAQDPLCVDRSVDAGAAEAWSTCLRDHLQPAKSSVEGWSQDDLRLAAQIAPPFASCEFSSDGLSIGFCYGAEGYCPPSEHVADV